MRDSTKAVFLSYASQDADAARRIAEALGDAGLEVWFDKSELRGGDVWDASIRKRIKGCSLFVPVISAVTNSRSEGYFRLEWKLAVERSHLMAEDQPFIVPVVIDETGEADARVPDAFRARQWTRLPGGETPRAFCDQVKRLLCESPEPEVSAPRPSVSTAPISPGPAKRPAWMFPALGVAALAIVAAGVTAWQPWKSPAPSPFPAAATVATSSAGESIAVLPFANLSPDKDNEFFADGIADELISVLSRVPGLRVSARSASFSFKGKDVAPKEIARQLGVNYIVEGSVRRAGSQARITVQVSKGADGFPLWNNTYNQDIKDIFAVQDEIATSVARALQLRFGDSAGSSTATRGTKNPAAYEAFLRGREAWYAGREDEAQRLLEEAIRLDPGFAIAHGALAELLVVKAQNPGVPGDKLFAQARASAEKALSLDDRVVQAHNALAEYAFHFAWEWEESDRHMQRAFAVDPNYFLALRHHGNHELARNRLESGLAAHLKVASLNPLLGNAGLPWVLIEMGRYEEAIRVARQDLAEHPNRKGAQFELGEALFMGGQREEGLRTLEEAFARDNGDIYAQARIGWAYGRAGHKDKALAAVRRIQALGGGGRDAAALFQAIVYAGLDDRERTFALLERGHADHDAAMPFIGILQTFRHLHGDPRFRALLKEMKLDTYFPETPAK